MKIRSMIEIIKSNPTPEQDEIDINKYIGTKCKVIGHWKQKDNEDWNKGQIQVELPGEGTIILNKNEYRELPAAI